MARRHAPRIEARTPQFALLTHASTPAPGSAGTVAVSVGDFVGDAVGDTAASAAAAAATATTAGDADRLCPGGTATVTICVLQWLRSHDAMLASLSGRKMRPFKPVVSAAPPPTANYYYLSFRLAPSLTASAAVQFAASARQSAAREGSTHIENP